MEGEVIGRKASGSERLGTALATQFPEFVVNLQPVGAAVVIDVCVGVAVNLAIEDPGPVPAACLDGRGR